MARVETPTMRSTITAPDEVVPVRKAMTLGQLAWITGQSLLSHSSIGKQEADSLDLSQIPRNFPF